MANPPRAGFCGNCKASMQLKTSGVCVEAIVAETKMSYYKVYGDIHECCNCAHEQIIGFGEPMEHYEPGYAERKVDIQVYI